ncbi:DUF1281 family ferredoxin-like fold protein [Zavarzinella formosa]|uniref:DUF1281 family ferredoxin-like fold protein n=1 Tax=Zavarzinella formosa TaxID=360055 RepID=UPI0002FA85C1|nr:hypothetical protein [Zavarzinella formosa]
MPNHISNKLTFDCDTNKASEVFEKIGNRTADDGELLIDFNTLIQYPERFALSDQERREWEKANPKGDWNEAPKDGYNQGGYEWCCKNWGTKWNAYAQKRLSEVAVYFETAWSTPEPIFSALSAWFPEVPFTVEYADEDIGSNAGIIQYRNGKKGEEELKGVSAAKLWFKLNPDAEPKDYGYDPETFECGGDEGVED